MAGSAFFTAASGLRNHQLRIDAIANNIANVNTAGYKGSQVVFADVLSQTLRGASAPTGDFGGINAKQVGLGMQIAAIHTLMQQSALENTSRQTDFAINGSGFFVLSNGSEEIYTRAGDFNVDRNGTLVANNGYKVLGYNQLTADGTEIDPGSRIGDIRIEFGKKLEAKASSMLTFKSNLDSASYRYGSANNESANVGTTGILAFAGAAEPWVTITGDPITAGAVNTLSINGNVVNYDTSAFVFPGDEQVALETIAEAINSDPVVGVQVQATVFETEAGAFQLVVQAINAGTSIVITGSTLAETGIPDATFDPAAEPGSFLVGSNAITVTEAKAATETTTVPVGTGANAPVLGDSWDINGITVTLAETYLSTNTAAQNAVTLAREINETLDIPVTATANPNGTITLTHNFEGKQRQPLGVALPAYENADIYLDFAADPTVASRLGFSTLGGYDAVNDIAAIDNGVNAVAELVFTPEDGSNPLTRFYEDWSYDRSIPALALGLGFNYGTSALTNVQSAIEGSGASFPLLPGVNISVDELASGQASFRTEDAFVHTTSRIVYDSLGNAHNLTISFTHINENEWEYEVSLPEEPNLQLNNTVGRLLFSQQGLITNGNAENPVTFTASGADASAIDLIFDGNGDAINGITQYAAATTTAAREQDGYAMGVLSDFEADASGTIIGFYDNGERRPIAQLTLATFNNPEGLVRDGDTAFQSSSNSGQAVLLRPATGGAGVVFNGFIEQSNVDLALEFTNMIITQRGLQANSRVFTTQDEILNEIVNLKR